MAEDTRVEIAIEANKNTGAIQATANELEIFGRKVQDVGGKSEEAAKGAGAFEEAVGALESKLAELGTVAAVGAFFKGAVEEAVQEAEAMRELGFAVNSTGGNFSQARG